MVVKTREIQGSEPTGAEETEARAAQATGEIANIAVNGLLKAARKGLVTIKQKREDREKPPELNGQLFKDFRAAFINNGVPKDIATQAAADLVQNKDADTSPAIKEANRIVVQGVGSQTAEAKNTEAKPTQPKNNTAELKGDLEEAFIANDVSDETAAAAAADIVEGKDEQNSGAIRSANRVVSKDASAGAVTKETVAPKPSIRAVDFPKPPAEMSWRELQAKAKEIKAETGEKPASQKKADVQPFVTDYWQQQQADQQPVAKPVLKPKPRQAISTPVQAPSQTPTPSPSAKQAESTLAEATPSAPAVANNPTPAQASEASASEASRTKLQQMYYDVLAKQKTISPELADRAAKDLANGKGARSSENVKIAHDTILNKELARSGLSKHKQRYSQYSRHVMAANPQQKDVIVASKALQNSLSPKDVRGMITNASPVSIGKYKSSGAKAVTDYVSTIATHAKVYSEQQPTAQKQSSTGQKKKNKQQAEI